MNSSTTTLDQTRPILPVRLLNGCGTLLDKSRIPRTPIRAVDLIKTARRRCGLDDFGGSDFFEGLSRLIDSCQRESQPDRKNCPSGRSYTDIVFTLVYATGWGGVSKHRATGNSRTALHRWFATQRYDRPTHLARRRSRSPGSPDLGSHVAIPTYWRQ